MKLLKTVSILLLAFLLFTTVYAGDDSTVTFEGVDFNIPDGFNITGDIDDYEKLGSDAKTCQYANCLNETIELTVITDWMGMSLDDLYRDGAFKKTVNSHKGWCYDENNLHYFGYVDDDCGILIGVTNQSSLSEIII